MKHWDHATVSKAFGIRVERLHAKVKVNLSVFFYLVVGPGCKVQYGYDFVNPENKETPGGFDCVGVRVQKRDFFFAHFLNTREHPLAHLTVHL